MGLLASMEQKLESLRLSESGTVEGNWPRNLVLAVLLWMTNMMMMIIFLSSVCVEKKIIW